MSENQAIEEFIQKIEHSSTRNLHFKRFTTDPQIYNEASEDYESFWAKQVRELLTRA